MEKQGITSGQLKKLHTLLHKSGLMEQKAGMVSSYSGGRTASSRELTAAEANALIRFLVQNNERQKLIRRIWHLAFECGIIYGAGKLDMNINAGKLDLFCKTRGTVKKPLSEQNVSELKRTHRQFECIYRHCKDKQQRDRHIEDLREGLRVCAHNEEYEQCSILQNELESITNKPKRKRHERVFVE